MSWNLRTQVNAHRVNWALLYLADAAKRFRAGEPDPDNLLPEIDALLGTQMQNCLGSKCHYDKEKIAFFVEIYPIGKFAGVAKAAERYIKKISDEYVLRHRKPLAKEFWDISLDGDGKRVIAGIWEFPENTLSYEVYALSDLPNDLISCGDLERFGIVAAGCELKAG